MITGSESDEDSTGSTKDPTPAQDGSLQEVPVDDSVSFEAKVPPTSTPAQNLTFDEGVSSLGNMGNMKRSHGRRLEPKLRKQLLKNGPTKISNDLDEQQERYQAAQLQGTPAPPTPVYPRGYYPPDAGSGSPMFLEHLKAPRGLNHGRTSRDAYERASVQDEPLFVNDIEAARCVLLAPHRISLKEFTSLRKKPEDRGGLFPIWGYPWIQPENTTTQSQAEDLFWRWVSLKNFTVQELKELREDRLLSYVLDQRDLRAHLIAKRQPHSVMEGLRQQSKSSAQDEGGYGTVNPGTVHHKAAKKPRTTYARLLSLIPDLNNLRAVNPEPVFRLPRVLDDLATSQAAGAFQTAAALGRTAPHGSGSPRSDQGGQEELSHAFEYEAPSQPHSSGPSTSGRDSVGSLLNDEVRQLWDRVYAIEIALGLGPGGQAASQAGKPGTLEVLRHDLDALGRETHELHGRVDRRAPAAAVKELRRGLDVLSHEMRGRMLSYEPQGYSYHSAYGYSSYASSSHSVPSYPSYESRGYQSVFHSQVPISAAPVVQRTQPRFEEVIARLGLPPSEEKDPADRDTA
ncbi:LOW QUALITY PROTEIN: ATP-binding cassette (ABC) Superfamily [Phytophthora palmivora]|uniref:ATP-binding cassette (ABC) Superfamily n=1 Tax=Phytophthora palmivora TaxID=4796 RepID=A0A2P4XTP0_9STRA|nr:LOW QUALITY PROTEIN: ATP-binding cassette (ABC) Superfamily [Phytophthora palmivora]